MDRSRLQAPPVDVAKRFMKRKPSRPSGHASKQPRHQAISQAARCIPNNWLDPLLSGPRAVIGKYPYGCPGIERLLNRIRADILSLSPDAPSTRRGVRKKK